jgi:hypothetical protein
MLRKYRFTTALAVAIALCAAAPAAAISPDAIDAGDKGLPTVTQDMRSPDAVTPFDATTDLRARHDPHGRPTGGLAGARGVEVSPSGFEWGDAGIGAAGMLAVILLAAPTAAGASTARRCRSSSTHLAGSRASCRARCRSGRCGHLRSARRRPDTSRRGRATCDALSRVWPPAPLMT